MAGMDCAGALAGLMHCQEILAAWKPRRTPADVREYVALTRLNRIKRP